MKALIRLTALIVLVAILLLPGSALISASEDWVVYMTVTTDPDIGTIPGEGYHLGFGARGGAMDGYDSGEGDRIAPPDPQRGINAHFYYPDNAQYQKNLIISVTGSAASVTWPLVVKLVGETGNADVTISWADTSNVPAKYAVFELQDMRGTVLAGIRKAQNYTFTAFEGQTYNLNIIAISEEISGYNITACSTEGGSVTVPGDGACDYAEGTVLDLVANPAEGYRFVNWTGDVDTVADVTAAVTNITLNGDYSITANFEKISSSTNRPLIGGLIAAVAIIGLLAFFLLKRRRGTA